jgi:hypothetical protein
LDKSILRYGGAGDPSFGYIIRMYSQVLHTKATLIIVADIRSDHRSSGNTPPARISMHRRIEIEERSSAPIAKDHTNPETDPRGLGCYVFRIKAQFNMGL